MSRKPLKSRELAYLENFGASDLDAETRQAIKDKKIILEDEPLYVRTKIAGGGEVDLLTAALDESVGVTNIDKRTLPKFVNFIIDAIQLGYASAATGTKTAVSVTYDSLIASVPIALQHANLVIKQNDVPILTLPVKHLLQRVANTSEFEGQVGYHVSYPRIIKQNVPFQFSIKFPDGQVLDGGVDHFVELWLKGTRTKLRGAK